MADKVKEEEVLELTEEQYEKLLMDLDGFDENFHKKLVESENYEIIPTTTEDGRTLSREQLRLLVKECHRLGLDYLYKVDLPSGVILLINPKTMKTGYISEGVH